jgi:hypothetical protein
VLEQGFGRLRVQRNAEQAKDGQNQEEGNMESGSGEYRSGSRRSLCAAVHRTPMRLSQPAFNFGRLRAALAAPDAILAGNPAHPAMLHFSKAPLQSF